MKRLFKLSIAGITLCIAACTAPVVKYNDNESYALNVAKYGGITGLRDAKVEGVSPTIENISSTSVEIPAAISAYNAPPPGLTGLQAGAINVVAWLLSPTPSSKENHHFAWMPESLSEKKTSRDVYHSILISAIRKTFNEMGIKYHEDFYDKLNLNIFLKKENGVICVSDEDCILLSARTKKPMHLTSKVPSFINSSNPSYHFSGHEQNILRFGKDSKINEYLFMSTLSKNLPSWSYIYTAPKKIKINDGSKLLAPVLFNEGKPNFFIKK